MTINMTKGETNRYYVSPVDGHNTTYEVFLEEKTTKESQSKTQYLITYFPSWQEIPAHLV